MLPFFNVILATHLNGCFNFSVSISKQASRGLAEVSSTLRYSPGVRLRNGITLTALMEADLIGLQYISPRGIKGANTILVVLFLG